MRSVGALGDAEVVDSSSTDALAGGSTMFGRLWGASLGWHLVGLAVVLVALVPLVDVGRSFTPDEGLYGLQVVALDRGGWDLAPPSAAMDPELEFPPWRGTELDGSIIPYAHHPSYPLLLQAFPGTGRDVDLALVVVGLVGVLAAAAAGWRLGAALRLGSERLAFWLTAASPMAFHGFVLWAHAPAAAAAAWGAVAIVAVIRGGRLVSWLGCCVALLIGLLLRSESLLFAAAALLVLAASAVLLRRRDLLFGASVLGVVVGVAVVVERRVTGRITDGVTPALAARGSGSTNADPAYMEGRIEATYESLLNGSSFSDDRSLITIAGLVLLLAGVGVIVRRGADTVALALFAMGCSVLVLRVAVMPADPSPGLLVVWPVVIVGVAGLVEAWRRGDAAARSVCVTVVLTGLTIAATQYSSPGITWGGRFLTVLVPILAVGAAVSPAPRTVGPRPWARGLLGAAIVMTVLGFVTLRSTRASYEAFAAAVDEQGTPLALSAVRAIPQASWRHDQVWMTVAPSRLEDALDLADEAGIAEVSLVWPPFLPIEADGWDVVDSERVAEETFDLGVYRLVRESSN